MQDVAQTDPVLDSEQWKAVQKEVKRKPTEAERYGIGGNGNF